MGVCECAHAVWANLEAVYSVVCNVSFCGSTRTPLGHLHRTVDDKVPV